MGTPIRTLSFFLSIFPNFSLNSFLLLDSSRSLPPQTGGQKRQTPDETSLLFFLLSPRIDTQSLHMSLVQPIPSPKLEPHTTLAIMPELIGTFSMSQSFSCLQSPYRSVPNRLHCKKLQQPQQDKTATLAHSHRWSVAQTPAPTPTVELISQSCLLVTSACTTCHTVSVPVMVSRPKLFQPPRRDPTPTLPSLSALKGFSSPPYPYKLRLLSPHF